MNPLQWVNNLFERRSPPIDARLYDLVLGSPSYAGPRVDQDSAMRSTAVFACVRIISESIAGLPLIVYRQSGRNKERAANHPMYRILHDLANPEMTSFEWREHAMAHVCAWGNHWSEKEFDNAGRIVNLWPLRPDRMESWERRADGVWWHYRLPDETMRWFPAWRLHHIRGLGNGVIGYSPITWAAKQAIGLSLATEEFGARFFSNGARPGGYLKHPGKLSDAAHKRLKESHAESHQGLSNAHRFKILEEGMDVATVGIPPNEAQFLETRKFQVTEIARIFRVPPHMLADLERATFSNIEHQSLEFVMHTLRPWLVRHEQAILRDLFTEAERRNLFAKYKVDGLLRGDTATRHQAYNTGVLTGYYTRNEVRELEDLNPLDGLDEPLIPLNMLEVGQEPPGQQNGGNGESEIGNRALPDRDARSARAESDRRKLINRHVRLFEDALGRVVKREIADIRKAANSRLGKRSIETFRAWLETFYLDLRGWMPDYLRSLMLTYAESMFASVEDELGDSATPDGDELREWIEEYLENFISVYAVGGEKQMRALLAEAEDEEDAAAKIHERLDGWEENRAQKAALDQAFEAGNALALLGYVTAGVATLVWRGGDCPLCSKFNGKRIAITGAFAQEGDEVTAEGVDPLPIVRTIRHGPLHRGCDCVVTAG